MSTIDTCSSTLAMSPRDSRHENGQEATSPGLPSPVLVREFGQPHQVSRLTTRSGPGTTGNMEHHDGDTCPKASDGETDTTNQGLTLGTGQECQQTHEGPLPIASLPSQIMQPPLCRSKTWSTILSTDEWVDETIGSLASLEGLPSGTGTGTVARIVPSLLGRSASQTPQKNWMVIHESSPVSRPGRAVSIGAGARLARQSRSKGVSLRSEGSRQESDYAVFIWFVSRRGFGNSVASH
ncbi:hypothetical protein VTK26DRAFT_4014 [Humicola hyalothermophila]